MLRSPPPLKLKNKSIDSYSVIDDEEIINVDCCLDIPDNYYEPMAVPTTFIFKWNRSQFKLLRMLKQPKVNGKNIFSRYVIQRVK